MPHKIVGGCNKYHGAVVVARCPVCGHEATFDEIPGTDDVSNESTVYGQRICPNRECRAHVFFVMRGNELLETIPPQQIEFRHEDIPEEIVSPMQEAITCHANGCHRAAALMVRRTLEVLCDDQGAEGNDLSKRIDALGEKVVISKDLLEGMHDLRLLGNDAAHVELKDYDDVGEDQASVAIRVAKTLLEVVYQHKGLAEELKRLKKQRQGAQ